MDNTNNTQKRVVRRKSASNIPQKQVKKGTSVGGKGLLIGMGVFFLFVIVLLFIFFFYLTSNPNAAKSFGIQAATVKSVTYIFAALLFGSLFILFLVLGLTYLYKLLTKQTGKVRNLIGTIIIFILGITNLVLGWLVFSKISKIKTGEVIKTTDVLIANVNYSDEDGEDKYVPLFQNNYPLIAPIKISFQLNKNIFDRVDRPRILQKEGNFNPVKFILDCGNGTKLEYTSYKFSQDKYCLYIKKGNYKVKFKFIYSTAKSSSKEYEFNDKVIKIDSEMIFKSKYLIKNGQIIAGGIGDKIKIDLGSIPEDLKLEGSEIDIDFEGNGNFIPYKGLAVYSYSKDGLYNVKFKIPEKESYPIYTFPLRIKYTDKPTCNIKVFNKGKKYIFLLKLGSYHSPIRKFTYKLENLSDYSVEKKGKGKRLSYNLKNGNDYKITWYIQAGNKKKGTCSKTISLSSNVDYSYDIKITNKKGKKVKLSGDTVVVSSIPEKFNILVKVKPDSDFIQKGFDIDGDGEIDENADEYELYIKEQKDRKIYYVIKDEKGKTVKKEILFKIDLKPVVSNLEVVTRKGTAPLKVKLDASSSKVNEEGDEIVYFNWDFGDGEKLEDTRQGIVTHVYKKPGDYKAKVLVITDKNYKDESSVLIRVYKPRNSAKITFPENIAGQVLVGEALKMQLTTNGLIKNIDWDFGDGNTFSCTGRECTSVSHQYSKKGVFYIEAKITYQDGSPSYTARATVNVVNQ